MRKRSILAYIKQLQKPVFTTHELSMLSGKSLSVTTQALNNLLRDGMILKIYRGVWAESGNMAVSVYTVIPSLFPRFRVYVSFVSALHLHGMTEQIPQVVTLASIAHTNIIRTAIGTYHIHRIAPSFFDGFVWYKKTGAFLIAEPEKALVDSLYLSAYKKRQFSHFPELHFSRSFNFKKVEYWIKRIPNRRIRSNVKKKLDVILKKYRKEYEPNI